MVRMENGLRISELKVLKLAFGDSLVGLGTLNASNFKARSGGHSNL